MREIDQKVAVKSALKVAILAALNVTDELFRERLERGEQTDRYEKKIDNLLNRLQEASTI